MTEIHMETLVRKIIPYLEDNIYTVINFDGWKGLGASAVLRAIAQNPPPSLLMRFDKIIHIDCSRWKSRRALQRKIAQEIKIPQCVMAIFDKADKEDDFRGVDEGHRNEIPDVGEEIYRALQQYRCLVVFHNGSNNMIDLNDFGISQSVFGSKVLWTFRGRFRLNLQISEEMPKSHLLLHDESIFNGTQRSYWLYIEATETARCIDMLREKVAVVCCFYLLYFCFNFYESKIMDFNWAIHASNYWVCDGIIQGGQSDEAWEVAAALHQQIRIEDFSSNAVPSYIMEDFSYSRGRWRYDTYSAVRGITDTVQRENTSFFLSAPRGYNLPLPTLPNDMFHYSDKLRVLKLCSCAFSFSSPPFHCCHSLRFLGLDRCKDQRQEEEEEDDKQDRPSMKLFQNLWVLDICYTDWELAQSPEIIDQMSANIREVHIKKGRIWKSSFAWRQLQNLRKLRVIEPTCPWETGELDEFAHMVKMEFLDLSGNSTIQVLSCLSGATSLKTMVLDGCVGLEHVGPEGLPPLLESFSLDAGTGEGYKDKAKISLISLAGCARLVNFRLRGSLPNLKELDLSGTSVKTLDLKDDVVQAQSLEQIILLGCLQLHAILWPKEGLPKLTVLRIDSSFCRVQTQLHQAYATIMDTRFFLTLVLERNDKFCWNSERFHLNLCVPSEVKGQSYVKEKMCTDISGQIMVHPRPNTYKTYTDVAIDKITTDHDYSSAPQFQPSGCHAEIGEGIVDMSMKSARGINAIIFVLRKAETLHVHDNSSLATVIPQHMAVQLRRLSHLKWCCVERCPKLDTVFTTTENVFTCFKKLENFFAAHLQLARCIWRSTSKTKLIVFTLDDYFGRLRSIHIYSCPRLTFVLSLCLGYRLSRLDTLTIVNCGDLKQVFPLETGLLEEDDLLEEDVREFPNLKDIYLCDLPNLQRICGAKMFAPKLETIRLRGCWGLGRLPSVSPGSRPTVDCEKDWWEKLEWDGLEAGHHPSLFEPRHSSYHKKPLPRVSVLR